MEEQEKRTLGTRFKSFILQSKRVLRITRKPSMDEFKIIVKVTGIGILIIGFIGFLVHIGGTLLIK